ALETLAEQRDGVDLERAQQVPVDPSRPRMCGPRGNDLRRRDQEIHRQIVRQHRNALRRDLERVDRREDRSGLAHLSFLAQEPLLEVQVAAALADACAVATDADRAAHDEVDWAHLTRRHGTAVPTGAGDAGRQRRALPEALRVDLDEALLRAESRDCHVDDLSLLEGEPPHGELWCVRVYLDNEGAAPDRHLAEERSGLLRPDEVGNATRSKGEPADRFPLNRLPDPLADLRLRHRASTLRCGGNGPTLRYYRVQGESILKE